MELKDYRQQLDGIDTQILRLFSERMDIAAKIGAYKKSQGLPVLDVRREREKLNAIAAQSREGEEEYAIALFSLIMELSRASQNRLMGVENELTRSISRAIQETPPLFPSNGFVACQGVEGANSELACEKLFKRPNIFYFSSFEAVFSAVEKGLCRYGVIPVENSSAGSVNAVYDLMMKYDFRIVRSLRLKVDHNLLALPGVKLEEIREIVSHEQALMQCSGYLQKFKDVKLVPCENTAVAAKMVAESGRRDLAALSSRSCSQLYGLSCLASSVQDQGNNHTRFICISKNLEIYPGADRTSLMLVLPHQPGSLYKVLSRFYALGINLNKLESRPLPDRDFEFMFYFDLDTPVYSPDFHQLMGEIESMCEEFHYLGSYSEVL